MRRLQARLLRCCDDQPVGPFWSYPLFLALSLCYLLMYSTLVTELMILMIVITLAFSNRLHFLPNEYQNPSTSNTKPTTNPTETLELRNPEPHKPHHCSPTSTAWGVLAWNTGRTSFLCTTDVLGVWVCCWSLLCVRTLLLIDCCARSNHLHTSACPRTFQYCLIFICAIVANLVLWLGSTPGVVVGQSSLRSIFWQSLSHFVDSSNRYRLKTAIKRRGQRAFHQWHLLNAYHTKDRL
jgi:hypothetical protein